MNSMRNLALYGMPSNVPEHIAATYRSRFLTTLNDLLNKTQLQEIKLTLGTQGLLESSYTDAIPKTGKTRPSVGDDEVTTQERANQYQAQRPLYTFEQLVIPETLEKALLSAVAVTEVEQKVFHEWGLKVIEPFPRTAMNFHGEPGTGKTLAAHAIAHRLHRPILVASYAEIESKFHGDGPKNVKAIFHAAERDKAVLFIDEADSLLSKRLTNVTQGSEQAINSMRSQLLICLQQFHGVVIFASNLVENYDKAFETRVRHLHFPMPDERARREIWKRLFQLTHLPLTTDVTVEQLAQAGHDFCGRDIHNAIIMAATNAALEKKDVVDLPNFLAAIAEIQTARIKLKEEGQQISPEEKAIIRDQIRNKLAQQDQTTS